MRIRIRETLPHMKAIIYFLFVVFQVMDVIDSLQVHQSEEVPTRKIAAFSYFYDRAVDAGMLQQGESAVVQVTTVHSSQHNCNFGIQCKNRARSVRPSSLFDT
jgi:hypothetical protein